VLSSFQTKAAVRKRIAALEVMAQRVDILWVVDFPSLPTALAVAKRTGTKVVYETVDLVPEYPYRGQRYRNRVLAAERRIIGNVDGFVTACDSYADYYMEMYGGSVLSRRPVVRDNMPPKLALNVRPSRRPLKFLFLGSLMFDRPVNELIDAMALASADITLTFQGKNYLGENLARRIASLGLDDRVFVLEPCPPKAIVEVASGYDIGIVALRGDNENERRASTSKLFTYMSAGLAIMGSDLPGIARVVNEYQNGILVEGMEPRAWAKAVEVFASLTNQDIDFMKQRSLDAAELCSWERQRPGFVLEFANALGTTDDCAAL